MKYIKAESPKIAGSFLSEKLQMHLSKREEVVWVVSGGSAINVAVHAAEVLHDTKGLHITLADERYGPANHPDSNWTGLLKAGFSVKAAKLYPVLKGMSADKTVQEFERTMESLLGRAGYKVVLLGLGADGHTAGILPGSPAVNSKKLVEYYEAADFKRITLTPKALLMMDEAVVFAQGITKHKALQQLDKDLTVDIQPAQLLKKIPRATIFNDYIGEEI